MTMKQILIKPSNVGWVVEVYPTYAPSTMDIFHDAVEMLSFVMRESAMTTGDLCAITRKIKSVKENDDGDGQED